MHRLFKKFGITERSGIFLNSEKLNFLFQKIHAYIEENNLSSSLELISTESFHITLYYLDKTLSDDEFKIIQNMIYSLKKEEINSFHLGSLQYFKSENLYHIGYLSVDKNSEYFSFLRQKIKIIINHDFVPDNQFNYLPHCTLFRIRNSKEFLKHKEKLSDIVNETIFQINSFSFQNIHLVSVDSTQTPEYYRILTQTE